MRRRLQTEAALASGYNLDDFKSVARLNRALREFGRRNSFAIVFHDDAARAQLLGFEKLLKATRDLGRDLPTIGDDVRCVHAAVIRPKAECGIGGAQEVKAASQSFQTGS